MICHLDRTLSEVEGAVERPVQRQLPTSVPMSRVVNSLNKIVILSKAKDLRFQRCATRPYLFTS